MLNVLKIDESQEQIVVLTGQKEVHVGAGVSVKLVDLGASDRVFWFGRGAKVELLKIATREGDGNSVVSLNLDSGSEVKVTVVCLSADITGLEINGYVNGEGAISDINVIYFSDQAGKFKLRIRNDFFNKNSAGKINLRGIAANNAKVEAFGEIGISSKAGGTDSRLDQHSLIFGKATKVRQLPILEVNTNDVRAGHGAAVSRIQDEELFYVLSRGVSKKMAYVLVVNGFLSVLLDQICGFGSYYDEVLMAIEEKVYRLVDGMD